jgi:serine protease Do
MEPPRAASQSRFSAPWSLGRPLAVNNHSYLLSYLLLVWSILGSVATASESDVRRDATVVAVEQVLPSVVNIATETIIEYHDWYDELLRQFYGARPPVRQHRRMDLGSGVIIDEEGYVLTNFHVVRRANRIQVKLWDGREYEADPVVATSASDVALIKIRAKPGEKFKAIKFAADDDLLLGETVIALGNPFGLGGSVTKGILSSKNRRPAADNETLEMEDWLQTDAAINPGNSGGPLINLRAELIGLNVAVYRGQGGERGVGVGFSIPIKQVSAALSHFFTPEVSDSLWFGAEFKAGPGPLTVSAVQPGSPADQAGLRVGDELRKVNGKTPRTLIECNRALAKKKEPVQLSISREGNARAVEVRLLPFEEVIRQKLGLTMLELDPQTASRVGYRTGEGLFVEEVDKGGPADRAGLQRGFLISGVEDQEAKQLRTFMTVLSGTRPGDTVRLTVIVPRRLGSSYIEFRQGTVDVRVR